MSGHYFDRGTMRQYRQHTAIEAFASDGQMLADAINGSKALLEALQSGFGPDRFAWRENAGTATWEGRQDSANSQFMAHHVNLIQQREAFTDTLRVKRDPCPVCATRSDIGCKHRRVA